MQVAGLQALLLGEPSLQRRAAEQRAGELLADAVVDLVPKAAAHVGIGFDDVCEQLLDGARLKVTA